MNRRTARAIAIALDSVAVALLAVGCGYNYLAGLGLDTSRAFAVAGIAVFGTVGTLIASRHPRNPIGWAFCLTAAAAGLSTLTDGLATYWLSGKPASTALGEAAAVYESNGWVFSVLLPLVVVLLTFPNGRLPSRRWRPVAWAALLGITGLFLTGCLLPGELDDYPISNPYGLEGRLKPVTNGLFIAVSLVTVFAVVASAWALAARLHRSSSEQRQQIKWLAWAALIAAPTLLLGTALGYPYLGVQLTNSVILTSILALPASVGLAILRHRLYDVDVVINKTLVYGALTALLAVAYLAGVLVLQLALSGVRTDSSLAVAGSTLVVAALFQPLRARVQAGVDRRFYRRRYDAARTLDSFSSQLGEMVDLGNVVRELTQAVSNTVQPLSVSLWLRDPVRIPSDRGAT